MSERAVPILPSRDLRETLVFYERLGFENRVDDADALHDEWHAVGVPRDPATGSRLVPPVDTDYGLREFALVDPSGNLVRVGSPLRS